MRRGLISLSKAELPDAVFDTRISRLRDAMAVAGLDALLVYTNNTRSAAASWVTGFVPYWSEAVLVLPLAGDPALVVALTNRVKSWIERTSRVAEVIHSPRIGAVSAQRIAAMKRGAAVGVVDLDGLPSGIAEDFIKESPGLSLRDATALFSGAREKADPAEIALAAKAGEIARQALSLAASEQGLATAIAMVEQEARRLGAEEVYMAAAPDLGRDRRLRRIEGEVQAGRNFALRATVAYKGSWVRMARTLARDDKENARADHAAALFSGMVALLPDDRGVAASSWLVEGCTVAQPLAPLRGASVAAPARIGAGMLLSVQATIEIEGRPIIVGAPVLTGAPGQAASVLVAPIFGAPIPSA